ncbi:hypothetical protein PLICRDRAFT_233571 [Plicaturopsis crispa FD-325 SS-3]|nr:hypothetical protein PLICRDRAFT_233571 [Plicaturopsis crispa FD-325 SS-3]
MSFAEDSSIHRSPTKFHGPRGRALSLYTAPTTAPLRIIRRKTAGPRAPLNIPPASSEDSSLSSSSSSSSSDASWSSSEREPDDILSPLAFQSPLRTNTHARRRYSDAVRPLPTIPSTPPSPSYSSFLPRSVPPTSSRPSTAPSRPSRTPSSPSTQSQFHLQQRRLLPVPPPRIRARPRDSSAEWAREDIIDWDLIDEVMRDAH